MYLFYKFLKNFFQEASSFTNLFSCVSEYLMSHIVLVLINVTIKEITIIKDEIYTPAHRSVHTKLWHTISRDEMVT